MTGRDSSFYKAVMAQIETQERELEIQLKSRLNSLNRLRLNMDLRARRDQNPMAKIRLRSLRVEVLDFISNLREHRQRRDTVAPYIAWIGSFLEAGNPVYGRCKETCEQMQMVFPELVLVPGHVHTTWGKREHFWLTLPSTNIVIDPTATQFERIFEYEVFMEGDPMRLGRCMDCGEEIWGLPNTGVSTSFCDEVCAQATDRYLKEKEDQCQPKSH